MLWEKLRSIPWGICQLWGWFYRSLPCSHESTRVSDNRTCDSAYKAHESVITELQTPDTTACAKTPKLLYMIWLQAKWPYMHGISYHVCLCGVIWKAEWQKMESFLFNIAINYRVKASYIVELHTGLEIVNSVCWWCRLSGGNASIADVMGANVS